MNNTAGSTRGALSRTTGIVGILSTALSNIAFAQTGPPVDESELGDAQSSVETIVTTATRISREGYSAPTPTTVVGREEIENRAAANIADLLNTKPALASSKTPNTALGGSSYTLGANLLNLRNLGENRTLVLLNGQRVTPNTATGNIDVNLLPTGLVEYVDVVTGGASASWGSDAIAGVVNFVLDKDFTGFKGNFQAGESGHGDGETLQGSLSFGAPFAGGRGHALLTGQYLKQEEVGGAALSGRSWYRGWQVIRNPDGSPTNILLPNVGLSNATAGGLITNGPLANTQFVGPDGTPVPFNRGYVSGLQSVFGSAQDDGGALQLQVPLRSGSAFGRVSYDLTSNITLFAEATYGQSEAVGQNILFNRLGNLTIRSGNAFLDPGIQAQMTANNISSFGFGTTNQKLGFTEGHADSSVVSVDVGAEGSLGNGWTWDARYQHGEYDQTSLFKNNAIIPNYNLAIDAVRNPANGQIVCRVTLTDPSSGCYPLNPFGTSPVSPQAKAYVMGVSVYELGTTQDDVTINVRGTPFDLWAGPVSIAFGGEYRRQGFKLSTSELDQQGILFFGNTLPTRGAFNVTEGYAEIVAPLLSGVPLVKALDFNGAVRQTSYSVSGDVTTWKLGFTYDANDQLRLRTTRSRDIRAPNLQDLFATGFTNNRGIFDPVLNLTYQAATVTSGNAQLTPEIADTTSGGIVITPQWIPGLSFSADYYRIEISDAILPLTEQQVINQCAAGAASVCSLITRDATGLISSVQVSPANAQVEAIDGMDYALTYHFDLADAFDGFRGSMVLNGVATDTWKRTVTALGQTIDYAGTNGDDIYATPRWRGTLSATYSLEPITATVTARAIGSGVISKRTPAIVNNSVPSVTYLDLNVSYDVSENSRIYFGINNIGDRAPPVSPRVISAAHLNTGANGFIYDLIGRRFVLGARFNFD